MLQRAYARSASGSPDAMAAAADAHGRVAATTRPVWIGPQGHGAAATIGADPASATSRRRARSSRPPRARGRATRGRAEHDDRDGRALLKRLLALRPDPGNQQPLAQPRGGGAGSLITRRDARVRPARADAVDRRRGLTVASADPARPARAVRSPAPKPSRRTRHRDRSRRAAVPRSPARRRDRRGRPVELQPCHPRRATPPRSRRAPPNAQTLSR
jgi:hypothetical protein